MAHQTFPLDQDDPSVHPPDGPSFCANNCGFFGSSSTMNLCSQCYRDLLLAQTISSSTSSSSPSVASSSLPPPDRRSDDRQPQPDQPSEPPRQPLNRCSSCRKRVGLTGFKCRCGNVFCSLHRYSDKHGCPYDYRTAARDAIAKSNPLVKADKLDKI